MTEISAFFICVAILAAGDLISTKTKAVIPSVFAISVIVLAGYWSGLLDHNIFAMSGISTALVFVIYYLQLPHMGTLMGIQELKQQWKVILIATSGIIGLSLLLFTIGRLFFAREMVFLAAPPLAGGIVALQIMRDFATEKGWTDLIAIPLGVYVLQSFIGYPLTAFLLKRESRQLLKERSANPITAEAGGVVVAKTLIPPLPEKYNSEFVVLAKLAFAGFIGMGITTLTGEAVSRYVVLLVVGFVLAEIGFLDRRPLNRSMVFGFSMYVILGFVIIDGMRMMTWELVKVTFFPIMGIMCIGVTGLLICAAIVGKFIGMRKEMAMSVALTALYGYPSTFILPTEAIKAVTDDEAEKQYLSDLIIPKMLVGGFVTVTIGSVFLAGLIIKII